jgi:hypothetical protein
MQRVVREENLALLFANMKPQPGDESPAESKPAFCRRVYHQSTLAIKRALGGGGHQQSHAVDGKLASVRLPSSFV